MWIAWIAYIIIWICCTFLTYTAMQITDSVFPLLFMIIPITIRLSEKGD